MYLLIMINKINNLKVGYYRNCMLPSVELEAKQ